MHIFEYTLHRKTITALAFFRQNLIPNNCRRLDMTEQLYSDALMNVALAAYHVANDRTIEQRYIHQDRVTIKINSQVNRALYLFAVQTNNDEIEGLGCFPTFVNGVDEVIDDVQMIINQNKKSKTSLAYQIDQRLINLRKEISRQCSVVAQ